MANYNLSILKVYRNEGYGEYTNDDTDNGRETFTGISRVNFPNWDGWEIIDSLKSKPDFKEQLKHNLVLLSKVNGFYKANFWDKLKLDLMKSQEIADMIMDSAVNKGIFEAVKVAQQIVGLKITGKVDQNLINKINSIS